MKSSVKYISFLSVLLLAATPTVMGASETQSDVYVIHGIPGEDLNLDPELAVDVSVNGACALPGFTFGEIVGPLPFDEGTYDIAISLANEDTPCANDPVIEAPGVEIMAGKSYSIIANLTEDGSPTANVFENDVTPTDGQSRVIAHHTAAAGTVDVKLTRAWPWWYRPLIIEGFSNGDQAAAMVEPGWWYASILLPDNEPDDDDEDYKYYRLYSHDTVFGPVRLILDPDTVYLVYAVGSLTNETFNFLVQPIEPMMPATSDVYVLHGIPGEDLGLAPELPVDVAVNGACALPGFTFGEFVGPLPFDEGTYDLAISVANVDDPCSEVPVIEALGVEIMGGKTYVIAAHLTEDGAPTAGVFDTEIETDRYMSKVEVYHLAAAPAVDVELKRKYLRWIKPKWITDLANGQKAEVDLYRGYWNTTLYPAGADDPVFGPVTLTVQRDMVYLVFAIGSLANGTFDLFVEPFSTR
jgi:hypothetical protein